MSNKAEFRLSITRALADQLAEGLAELDPAPLDQHAIDEVANRAGVYQLYENQQLVYVGKAEESLRDRLATHHRKLLGRLNLGALSFACLYVDEDLHAVAPERLLIRLYQKSGRAPWNTKGFGANDPGRNRDSTVFEEDHFDVQHPADLDWRCVEIQPGTYSAEELLKELKKILPYLFRYQSAAFHREVMVEVHHAEPTAEEVFRLLGEAITEADADWQITALPGYVIMYPKKGPFPSARRTYPTV